LAPHLQNTVYTVCEYRAILQQISRDSLFKSWEKQFVHASGTSTKKIKNAWFHSGYVTWYSTVNTLNISIHRLTEYFKSEMEIGSVFVHFFC
jgi:hypothetical protein